MLCLFDSLSATDSGLSIADPNLPALAKLCENSVIFNRTYTTSPESSPARASLFTGLDPCVHGLWTNGVPLSDNEQTFAQRLAQAGYSNYLAGRYQLSGLSRWTTEQTRQCEFDQADWAHGPLHRSRQNAYLVWLQTSALNHYSDLFPSQADPDNTLVTQQQRDALEALPDELSFNHWVGRRVGEWIANHPRDKPFLAIAGFSVGSMLGTQPHADTDAEGLLPLALQQADTAISCLMAQLAAGNRLHDTVIIVTSARGNSDSANLNNSLNESAIRVPLLISGAGYAQQIVHAPISTIDIAPTVLDLANAPIGQRMQGQSLLDVLDGSKVPRGWAMSRIRKNSSTGLRNWQTALCMDAMKLVVCHDDRKNDHDSMCLYNLSDDPFEKKNLAGLSIHETDLEHMIDQMIDARCALEDRTQPRIAEF